MSAVSPIERSVRAARRRLFLQALVNRLAGCLSAALLLGLGWVVAEPLLVESPPEWLRWAVVGGLAGLAVVLAVVWARLATPSAARAALEVDTRFGLAERVTTALGLAAADRATPAGQAVLADAAANVAPLAVKDRFPVRPRWPALFVPALAGCVALAAVFPVPLVADLRAEADAAAGKTADPLAVPPAPKPPAPFTQRTKPPELARAGKGKDLQDLEESINELMRKFDTTADRETPERLKEKVTELTSMEEKVRKFNQEKFDRLAKTEQQLRQLDRLNKDEDFRAGPAKELNDALSKGDLQKAQAELDQLKKKLQEKKLSKDEQEQLARQVDKMRDQLQRQADASKDRQRQLQKLVDEAKKAGKDAEALERELNQLREDSRQSVEAAQQLAEKFQKARDAMQKGDVEEAAKELEQAAKGLQGTEGDLKDLEDAEDYLQRLKGEKKAACKKCGECEGTGEPERKDDAEWSPIGRVGSGLRKEDKDAKTGAGDDQRVRGLFDPKGKKTYGGGTKGPAFKKATAAELGPAIQEAAQDAPKAAGSQRLPRDAKDSVKEYFQNLGGQNPGGK